MPTYIYEIISSDAGGKPVRFEIRQSMKEAPLTQHPQTGEPVRRVPIGGTGVMGGGSAPKPSSGGSCGSGCGCH
jgi:predicted nucleic acid-binding Zn ribbon protein